MKKILFPIMTVLFLNSCQDGNFVVTEDKLCDCNANDVDNPCTGAAAWWQKVVTQQQEVAAHDFKRGNYIGTECQGEVLLAWDWPPVWFNSWRPVDGYRHTLSGTLDHFNWNYNDDEDWNLHCVPNPDYRFLIDEVEDLHDESADGHNKCGGPKCMEAEISPDKKFWQNPWFFAPGASADDADNNGYSWLEGRQMCFFGPWIMDANHDFKSEIHPAEMIWWKDHYENGFGGDNEPFDVFLLMLLQDNTGRFDDRDNYDCDGDAPAGWKPWTDSPVSGQFSIAFEVDLNGPPVHFEIVEIFNRFVVTSNDIQASADADDGKDHALVYQGKTLVTVTESQPNDNDLGVSFTGLCKRPNGKMQGFVSIRSAVGGNDDKDEEGFHVLYVARKPGKKRGNFPDLDQTKIPDVFAQAKLVENTIVPDPKGVHTANVQLELLAKTKLPEEASKLVKIQAVGRDGQQREVAFKQDKINIATVSRVPLLPGTKLSLTFKSGKTVVVQIPVIALAGATTSQNAQEKEAGGGVWKEMLRIFKADTQIGIEASQKLLQSGTTELRAFPVYGVTTEENSSPEYISPAVEVINSAINRNDKNVLKTLFLSEQPFQVKWTFRAKNLVTGINVPVNTTGTARKDEIGIKFFTNTFQNDSVSIRYPAALANSVIECEAIALISDAFGHQQELKSYCWNHRLASEAGLSNNSFAFLRQLGGIKDNTMGDGRSLPKAPVFTEPGDKERKSLALRSYFLNILRDKSMTIGEIREVIGLKERLK